jgi:hypothetical protein
MKTGSVVSGIMMEPWIRTTMIPGFGDQKDKELGENGGYASEEM